MALKKMLTGLSGLALIAAVHGGLSAAGEAPANRPPVTWTPQPPSIVYPSDNSDKDAWEAYKSRSPAPSADQHLTDPVLNGALDLHAHFGPDSYNRQWDAFEIAKMMRERGMRGAVFKNHWSESAGLAWLIRKYDDVPGFEAFGGLALNVPEGGINPQAVRYFAEVEGQYARIVWMPTHDAEHEVRVLGEHRPYVTVSKDGVLLPQVLEVLDLIKQYGLTLATGHVTSEEMLQIVAEAKKRGIEHIIITHPDLGPMFTDPSIEQMQQAVAQGAYVELVASELLGKNKDHFVEMIRTLGPAHCFVSSDSGLTGFHNHSDALVLSIRTLREAGFSEAELDLMFRRNPALLVGLPPLERAPS